MIKISKKIEIRIFPDGKIQAEVQGIKGKKCTDYIKIIEEILDAKTTISEPTKDFYENEIPVTITEKETIPEVIEQNRQR